MAQKQYLPHPELWRQLEPAVKQLREEQTPAEIRLWSFLRNRQFHGYKFLRQHAIDRFVVVFFCKQAALIIELDGPIHHSQVEADHERQKILEEKGLRVIRFTNEQVNTNIDQVLSEILSCLIHS